MFSPARFLPTSIRPLLDLVVVEVHGVFHVHVHGFLRVHLVELVHSLAEDFGEEGLSPPRVQLVPADALLAGLEGCGLKLCRLEEPM